jgi:hypothetical protein
LFTIGVPDAGVTKEFESVVVEVPSAAKFVRVERAPGAVAVVPVIVLAATVVEESEQTNDGNVGSGAGCE